MTDLAKWGREMFNRRMLEEIRSHAGYVATELYAIGDDEESAAKFQKLADAIFELYLD